MIINIFAFASFYTILKTAQINHKHVKRNMEVELWYSKGSKNRLKAFDPHATKT